MCVYLRDVIDENRSHNCVGESEKALLVPVSTKWITEDHERENWIDNTSFLHFHFISAVHILFTSYIINTHFFHGNIWTHNWPAPNVSGFIAQLVEHRTGNREVTGSNPVEVLNFFQAFLRNCIICVHCNDHFFIFNTVKTQI